MSDDKKGSTDNSSDKSKAQTVDSNKRINKSEGSAETKANAPKPEVNAKKQNEETAVTQSTAKKLDKLPPQSLNKGKEGDNELFGAKKAPKLSTRKSSSKLITFPLIASLLSVFALVAVGWTVYGQYQLQQQWELLQQSLKNQVAQQDRFLGNYKESIESSLQLAQANQRAIEQQARLSQQLEQLLTVTQQKVRALSGRQKQDWLLAEAEYLIKLAQLKISLEKDKVTAIALLKTADQRVLEIGDNSLLELRQQIAQDIVELELSSVPDVNGIASRLHAISNKILQLDLIALKFEPLQRNAERPISQSDEFSWSGFYRDFIDDFVTIKDHSEPAKPLMTVEQRANLNANIQLALQQSQIALVRGEQALYQINLNNAINWIGEFFQHNELSRVILTELAELSETLIDSQMPGELVSKQAIHRINQQRLYQWLGEAPEKSTKALQAEDEESR